jgi:GntR family transcriptional regulator
MTTQAIARTRREQIVDALARRIRGGELQSGDRLGSEAEIAAEFAVSRGTVRQALRDLQEQDLIATRAGVGSFVTFEGTPLDAKAGWARALTATGADITTEELGIELMPGSAVPDVPQLGSDRCVMVRRRRLLGGTGVSYERAVVPAHEGLASLPDTGLVNHSLTETLRGAGLVADHGTQDVSVATIGVEVADILGREPGSSFLRTVRISFNRSGQFVERVESYLDPAHFSLHLTFGDEVTAR